jgi:hypothetical protein
MEKKLAIMQPYFFPYIGYFSLINLVDEFIIFDTPQFIRHGWIERNRILKQNGEPIYISIPLVKKPRETSILDMEIRNTENWKNKILAQLVPYKKKAPFYYKVVDLLNSIFELQTDNLVEMNIHALKTICNYLGITTPIKIWSKMDEQIGEVTEPDEWALEITKALGGSSYINPIGGKSFFNKEKYNDKGINIQFLEQKEVEYNQFTESFIPNLSIIDTLMFNDVDTVKELLNKFKLTS